MVGIDTVIRDDPSLTTRLADVIQHNGLDPIRIILDTRLRIPETAKVLRLDSDSDTLIITGPSVSGGKKSRLEKKGAKVITSPVKSDRIDLDSLMDHLGALGVTSLLIEGGSRVIASAFSAGIVEKIVFFYAPKILGGDDGVPVCRGPGPESMQGCIPVKHLKVRRFDDDVMLEGYIDKN